MEIPCKQKVAQNREHDSKPMPWHDEMEPIHRPISQPSVRSGNPGAFDEHHHHSGKYPSYHHGSQHKRLDRSHSEPISRTPANVNATRYKTELCRPYEENGGCKYGDKCQFAHGFHELRSLSRHPKYKTELCKTFHTSGFCPYGPRCHFIHNADETRALAPRESRKPKPGPFYLPAAPGSLADSLSPPPSISSVSPPPSATANTAFSFAPLVKFTPPDSPMDSYSPASSPSPVGSPVSESRLPVFNRLSGPPVVSLSLHHHFSGELMAQ
ncbi:unnamed protein product [Bemisia tabaci]|uniref:C3H1-type domain-containing protein n=1 Tax=Bemisia tabaci TaxID=7038 RepID=A0A9P0A9Q4_BEMTA|nr:unnamed protein product [Bemisia tabaci]